jgi:hypothetical protein
MACFPKWAKHRWSEHTRALCVYTRLRLDFCCFHPRVRFCKFANSTPVPICKYGWTIFTPTTKLYSWKPLANSYMPWDTKHLSGRLFLFCLQFREPRLRLHVKSNGTVKHVVHHSSGTVCTSRSWVDCTAFWVNLSAFLPTLLPFFISYLYLYIFIYLFIFLSIRDFSC